MENRETRCGEANLEGPDGAGRNIAYRVPGGVYRIWNRGPGPVNVGPSAGPKQPLRLGDSIDMGVEAGGTIEVTLGGVGTAKVEYQRLD